MIINLPYAALRPFEAVVRLSSFSAAAEELNVSQSAVSQHVKSLEEWLGVGLMVRGARQSRPTREGELLARAIADGLGSISEVCNQLRHKPHSERTITVCCLPGFAVNWLFPRLLRFDLLHPDLSVSITTDTGWGPLPGPDTDVSIRYGGGDFPGQTVELLMQEHLFPVCSPGLLSQMKHTQDLGKQTLLVDETQNHEEMSPTWKYWAKACGVELIASAKTRRFGQSNLVVQAAVEGLGVALGREPLVIDALKDGRLVRPFPHLARSPYSYWLVRPKSSRVAPRTATFLDWIKSEAEAQHTLPPTTT